MRDGARELDQGRVDRDRRSRSCSAALAAFAVHRFRFFGRQAVSFVLVLPIALPGIVTGDGAADSASTPSGSRFSLWTIMIGHATFCIVVVFNNVVARLRRTPTSLVEASHGPGRRRVADVPLRHPARDRDGARGGRRCSRSRCRSTRSSSRTSSSGARSRCRSGSSTTIRLPKNRPEANAVAVARDAAVADPGLPRAAAGGRRRLGERRAARSACATVEVPRRVALR